jgi:hypothetical protein
LRLPLSLKKQSAKKTLLWSLFYPRPRKPITKITPIEFMFDYPLHNVGNSQTLYSNIFANLKPKKFENILIGKSGAQTESIDNKNRGKESLDPFPLKLGVISVMGLLCFG